jgi:hypothetical protein
VRLRIQVQSTGAPRRKKDNATVEKPYSWARRDLTKLSEVSARERMEKQREYDDAAKARREIKLDQRRRGVHSAEGGGGGDALAHGAVASVPSPTRPSRYVYRERIL